MQYLQMSNQRSQKTELYKIKKHKDLTFLTEIQPEHISDSILRFLIKKGNGNILKQIHVPLTMYYSFQKYDYTGKWVGRSINKSMNMPYIPKQGEAEENSHAICLSSMNKKQTSWFNICLKQKDSIQCSGFNGYHYQITLSDYVYKNDDTMQSKTLLYEENREKGKNLFLKKNYKEALKIYQKTINLMKGISKKFFKPDEIQILHSYLEKSQANYLKCVAKINGFGGRSDKQIANKANILAQKFMKKYPNSPNSFYQKAIYLKYTNSFDEALQVIKEGLKLKFDENPNDALLQRNALKTMAETIRKTKQRNIRHLERVQIRKMKAERRNNNVWNSDQQDFIQENAELQPISQQQKWDQEQSENTNI